MVDILCPAKKAASSVKRVTRRTAQPEEIAPIRPLRPEHVSQQVYRKIQPHKHVLMELPKPKVPIESQVSDEDLDQIGHPPTPKDAISEESRVPIGPPQPKPMISKQSLPQVLPIS